MMIRTFGLSICLAVGGASAAAEAQMFDQPFQFHRGGGIDGGPGISIGYREAVIDERLTGSRSDLSLRGPAGELLKVIDAGNGQAVLQMRSFPSTIGAVDAGGRSPDAALRFWAWPGSYGFIPDPAASITTWTAIATGLAPPAPRWIRSGHQPAPIDAWVMQAEALRYPLN